MTTLGMLQALLCERRPREAGGIEMLDGIPRLECVDGLGFSMQAGAFIYCEPRSNAGPWSEVELGFPTERVEAWMPYCDNAEEPTNTVYGYVPLAVVAAVIDAHGGLR